MGSHEIERELDAERLRQFTRKLLTDLRAIDRMLEAGAIESGVRRIGAEQELFLVGPRWGAASNNLEILADLADDDHFTTELGRFNLEFNLDPMSWGGGCLSQMEGQLDRLLRRVREAAERHGTQVVMTGILPTLEKADLTLDHMTPKPRYFALNEAMTRLRGGAYIFHLKGQDELKLTHDSVMLEACNTSFQVHFQTGPEEFARLYNIAQAVAAPVLAAATNSPLLFGKRLWRETRIALFQQSVDTRAPTAHLREQSARVRFGRDWIDDSVMEIFQEDVSRFRVLLAADVEEDPFEVLARGGVPTLQALRLFNGTIYRWNRPCYGISAGRPHLRIENRVLPAGPSLVDEVANAAFWLGLMSAVYEQHHDIRQVLHFDEVNENFVAAARLGLGAHLWWIGHRDVPARELLLEELHPPRPPRPRARRPRWRRHRPLPRRARRTRRERHERQPVAARLLCRLPQPGHPRRAARGPRRRHRQPPAGGWTGASLAARHHRRDRRLAGPLPRGRPAHDHRPVHRQSG